MHLKQEITVWSKQYTLSEIEENDAKNIQIKLQNVPHSSHSSDLSLGVNPSDFYFDLWTDLKKMLAGGRSDKKVITETEDYFGPKINRFIRKV